MDKTAKIILVVFVVFLLLNIWLGFRYWSLSKFMKVEDTQTQPQPPEATSTPFLPPPGKLIHPLVVGIQHYKVGNKDIYELVGWIIEADEQKREVSVGQTEGTSSLRKVVVSPETVIRLALVDENGELQHLPKAFADLIPGKVRVSILCKDAACSEAEIVSIIETQD